MKFDPRNLVLWSDETLLVVNKPAGLPTLPDGYDPQLPYLKSLLEPVFGRLWIVHRLDRAASGVLVLARTAETHRTLNTQFETRQLSKAYHALVKGSPPWDEKTVELPLLPDGDRKHRTIVDHRQGRPSVTDLRVLERLSQYTLVEALPKTGRTHQIRVHLAAQGFPIAADALYGDGKGIYLSEIKPGYHLGSGGEHPLLGRLGLHAWSLMIEHPLTHAELCFEAPYPKDLASTLGQMRRYLSQKFSLPKL
jgi:RluA family pseudouridine synthase